MEVGGKGTNAGCSRRFLIGIWFVQFTQGVQVTLPFTIAVYMVRTYELEAQSEQRIGRLTGFLAACFCLAQFLTSYPWGLASDRFGRKPVIVIGNVASMLAAVCLGFAGKYWMACLARFCGGFFNGIIGSLKTVVAETCPDSETQAFAMGYLSFGWGMGTIVGPAIGGLLSNPCGALLSHESPLCCGGGAHGLLPDDDALAAPAAAPLPADTLQDSDRDPHVCNGLLARFPFLLPCLAAAAGSAAAVVIVTALLQETLHVRAPPASAVPPRRRQARSKTWTLRRLLSCMCCCPGGGEAGFEMLAGDEEGVLGEKEKAGCEEELELELEMTAAPLRRSFSLTEAVHHLPAALGPCPGAGAAPPAGSSVGAGMSRREEGDERAGLLQITVHADSSAAVSPRHADSDPPVQEEAAPAAQPASVVYSDSPRPPDAHLPWYRQRDVQLTIAGYGLTAYLFNILDEVVPIYASAPHSKGGLGMPTQRLALPMSFSGVVLMLWALLCYPRLQRAIGPIRSANCGLFMLAPVALFIPAASLIASSATTAQVLLALALCLKNVSATNAFTSSMILVNTASPADALGSVNGAGQTLAAFVRAAGPATGGILWAASVQLATPGHQFLTFTLVAAAAWLSLLVYRFTHLPSVRLRWHQ